ncbi:rhodanese-like domain-containing protein [Aquisalimonas sp. 2447]|uniref:rhodanese-like domain-containing protein n=1 Tax=Aquisalimonas sp. 2447 TaxID=2740807 RepID=UPI0014324925|nr:rhodanese-like domain-containing protein [Aquisalimonas sp. 2447]QIT53755.1 rhodanese-like domain-containing protein [Aquisalimonas sp. 2447]
MSMDQLIEFVTNNWVLFLALAMVVVWIVVSESTRFARGVPPVDSTEATRLYNREDALFVDIRSEADFGKGHLPGAINVPNGNLDQRHKKLDKHKDKPVIVYDAQGMQGGKVGKQLKEKGFEKVHQLQGGFNGWQEANLPVHT